MRTFFLALAFLAPAAIASASDRMTDVEFLQASRCAAYLGDDAGQIGAIVKEQSKRREPFILERARDTTDQVERKIRRAKTEVARAVITAERESICAPVRAAQAPANQQPNG